MARRLKHVNRSNRTAMSCSHITNARCSFGEGVRGRTLSFEERVLIPDRIFARKGPHPQPHLCKKDPHPQPHLWKKSILSQIRLLAINSSTQCNSFKKRSSSQTIFCKKRKLYKSTSPQNTTAKTFFAQIKKGGFAPFLIQTITTALRACRTYPRIRAP